MQLFRPIPLNEDPLHGAYGLSWYERKPSSLTPAEWRNLDDAMGAGRISASEYADWKANVK
jgi:hypothetical protein